MYKYCTLVYRIDREVQSELFLLSKEFPITAILGPCQSGKTKLSQKVFSGYEYVSSEDIDHREFAQNAPRGFFLRYDGTVILMEQISQSLSGCWLGERDKSYILHQ